MKAEPVELPAIEEFLETWPAPIDDYVAGREEAFDLPPVEHFMDSPPEAESFAPIVDDVVMEADAGLGDVFMPIDARVGTAESDWGDTAWQDYDWRSAAALGEAAGSEATNAWAATDWDSRPAPPPPHDTRETAAHALAAALDRLAQRIRDGELAVPPVGVVPEQVTIAATLGALLGGRG